MSHYVCLTRHGTPRLQSLLKNVEVIRPPIGHKSRCWLSNELIFRLMNVQFWSIIASKRMEKKLTFLRLFAYQEQSSTYQERFKAQRKKKGCKNVLFETHSILMGQRWNHKNTEQYLASSILSTQLRIRKHAERNRIISKKDLFLRNVRSIHELAGEIAKEPRSCSTMYPGLIDEWKKSIESAKIRSAIIERIHRCKDGLVEEMMNSPKVELPSLKGTNESGHGPIEISVITKWIDIDRLDKCTGIIRSWIDRYLLLIRKQLNVVFITISSNFDFTLKP